VGVSPRIHRAGKPTPEPNGTARFNRGACAGLGQQIVLVEMQQIAELAAAVLALRQENGRRVTGEPVGKPLVVVGLPPQEISPPLMSNFMRDNDRPQRVTPSLT